MSRPTHSKSRLIIIFLAFCALTVFYFYNSAKEAKSPNSQWKQSEVRVADKTLKVYLAESPLEMEVGLSAFQSISDNQGMLFSYDPPAKPGFWMKRMKFSIDIIWINNNQVVDITKNLPYQSSELTKYYPNVEISQAIEVNAGWSGKNNIKVGDSVEIK